MVCRCEGTGGESVGCRSGEVRSFSFTPPPPTHTHAVSRSSTFVKSNPDTLSPSFCLVGISDNPLLRSSSFETHSWNWVARQPPPDFAQGLKVRVKIMSVSKAVEAFIQSLFVFLSSLSSLRGEGGCSLIDLFYFVRNTSTDLRGG